MLTLSQTTASDGTDDVKWITPFQRVSWGWGVAPVALQQPNERGLHCSEFDVVAPQPQPANRVRDWVFGLGPMSLVHLGDESPDDSTCPDWIVQRRSLKGDDPIG